MHPLGIEFLSVFGLPPVEFVELAAELDCQHISLGLTPYPLRGPYGFEPFDLREDAALRATVLKTMARTGVSIGLAEGFSVRANGDVTAYAHDLDVMSELGARRINTIAMETDSARCIDQIGALCDLAAERGMTVTLETAPGMAIPDVPSAINAIAEVGRSNLALLIDTMHVVRTDTSASDIASLPPEVIGYVQVSDVPLVSPYDSYFDEAMWHRHCPGDGELPLRELLAAIPDAVPISIEIPNLEEAEAGRSPRERVTRYLDATRALLSPG
jgi:sugar phosphate isomerase/epimerase